MTDPLKSLSISNDLDALAKARIERDELTDEIDRLIQDAIPPEIQKKIDDIKAEFDPKIGKLIENIAAMENNIKERVLILGVTVKGSVLSAIFNKGRVKWDNKALDGYAKAHPEILEFRSEGKPYISIR